MAITICGNVNPVAGSVATGNGTTLNFTAAGTAGQVLQSNGASAPTWVTPSSGVSCATPTVAGVVYGKTQTCASGGRVAIGHQAGDTSQGVGSIAIGVNSGVSCQGLNAIAIGVGAGQNAQGAQAIAIGNLAGNCSQASGSIVIGNCIAASCSGLYMGAIRNLVCTGITTAVGLGYCACSKEIVYGVGGSVPSATPTVEGVVYGKTQTSACGSRVALGYNAGQTCQGSGAIAIGYQAGQTSQGSCGVAIGRCSATINCSVTIGGYSSNTGGFGGKVTMGFNASSRGQYLCVAIGTGAGVGVACTTNSGTAIGGSATARATGSIALGTSASVPVCYSCGIAIGKNVAATASGLFVSPVRNTVCAGGSPVGLGYCTTSKEIVYGVGGGGASCATPTVAGVVYGKTVCLFNFAGRTAFGFSAGLTCQSYGTVAVGWKAGQNVQGTYATAIGELAGSNFQGPNTVAVGTSAGVCSQGSNAIAIGNAAGIISQGSNSIAIGAFAGYTSQAANTIILNATGGTVCGVSGQSCRFYVAPVRNATGTTYLGYNSCTKEITYSAGAPSDINLKENIQPIGCALNKTAQIRGVTFDWKSCGKNAIGVIAQEVESVFPQLVTLEGDGYKTVKYDNMVAVLIEAVKELKTRVETLESKS